MRTVFCFITSMFICMSSANAGLLIYTDRELWEAAASETGTITTDDFESYNSGVFTELSSDIGDLNIAFNTLEKETDIWPLSAIHSESSGSFANNFEGNYLQLDIDGSPVFDVTLNFQLQTYAFAFDFIYKAAWDETTVSILDQTFNIPEQIGKTSGFIGFVSDSEISSALFFNDHISGGRFGIDNLSLASVPNDTTNSVSLPVPATLSIFIMGLIALLAFRRSE